MKRRQLTKSQRLAELKMFIKLCFARLDQDMKEVANATGLSVSTLYRVQTDELTLNIRVGTLQAISNAAGLKLVLTKHKAAVYLQEGSAK